MVFDPTESYLYSADLRANKIWTHKKDSETGKLTLVGSIDAPLPSDHPRWVEMHPNGNYLYALMEVGNRLAVYVIDEHTHMPVFTHITYPLIPPGAIFPAFLSIHEATNIHYRPKHPQNVPRRCGFPLPQRKIPLRNLSRQLLLPNRLYQCL